MAGISLYENEMLLKAALLERLKTYRNFSVKFALLTFIGCFAIHYSYNTLNTDHLALRIDESLYGSSVFSLMFAMIGYCFGALYGNYLQKKQLIYVSESRLRKRKMLEEQIAIRKAKIESL